ncbi:MAG: hypothetical protein KDC80_17515 [Saprospiraceae bacterium]|nr:hypothetical protein [Saprospiraceae bacterium]
MKTSTIFYLLILLSHLQCSNETLPNLEDPDLKEYLKNEEYLPSLTGLIVGGEETNFDSLDLKVHLVQIGSPSQRTHALEIKPDGTFLFKLQEAFPYQQIWFRFDELFYCQLIVHDSLHIELDITKLRENSDYYINPAVKFTGSDAEMNQYLNSYIKFKPNEKNDILGEVIKTIRSFDLSLLKKLEALDSLNIALYNIENEFILSNTSDYSEFLINERLSDYYGYQFMAHSNQEIDHSLLEKALKHHPIAVSNSSSAYYRYLSFVVLMGSPRKHKEAIIEVLEELSHDNNQFSIMLGQYKRYLNGEEYLLDTIKNIQKDIWTNHQEDVLEKKWMAGIEEFKYLEPVKLDLIKIYGTPRRRG